MRIYQTENGVGGSTNGITHVSNGDVQESTNGQVSTVNKLEKTRQQEMVRLIVQALQDMGYSQSATMLEKESGYPLESQGVAQFREGVLNGNWALVERLLPTLELDQSKDATLVKFLIRQQKYLELLEAKNIKGALLVLREELTPLNFNLDRLHQLSSYIMFREEDLKNRANWDGAHGTSRAKLLMELQSYISPAIMVPERRLETLLEQATRLQRLSCLYHNTDKYISLYSDHECDRSQFPTVAIHTFEQHTDEVWYVAFSNNGKQIASASKDKTAIIWSLEEWKLVHVLREHNDFVSFLSWSPDDSMLLTCGQDNDLKLWDTKTGTCLRTMKGHEEAVTACAWLPDGKSFISGSTDKNTIIWNLDDGAIQHKWVGVRIMDLQINKAGTKMVAICTSKQIHVYDLVRKEKETSIEENADVTSLCLSSDCKYALVNLASREIHLWDIEERQLVRKYFGQQQGKFVIRSCFGGIDQGFIVSGSEDAKIYVWHREQATLIEVLSGHTGTVNSVNWSPVNPYMFASAADDNRVRIWGTAAELENKETTKTT